MTILSVPDLSCGHCKSSVEAALAPLSAHVSVDLPARQVTVDDTTDAAQILRVLADIGFPARIISA